VATYERAVWFRRGAAVERILAPSAPLWVALTPPGESTRVAVASVARFRANAPERYQRLHSVAERCAFEGRRALLAADYATLGAQMNDAHEALQDVGVSTPTLDAVCAAARASGAWGAKLTGAGLGGACLIAAPLSLDLSTPLSQAGAVEVFIA
jgi:mevalonate kinase